MITYIFGASEIDDYSYYEKIDYNGSFIICADGGTKHTKRLNLVPDILLGDFDSSSDFNDYKNKITYPKEKDDTDLGLAINYASLNGYKDCIAIGCLGNRLDHTYANISLLKYAYDKGVKLELIDENTKVFLVNGKKEILKEEYKYVSIFPFGNNVKGVTLTGFKYPLDNHMLSMEYPLGISNELIENKGIIEVSDGFLIVMMVRHECQRSRIK